MSASRTLLNKQGRAQGPVSRARFEIPCTRADRMRGKGMSLVQKAMAIARGEGRTNAIYREMARKSDPSLAADRAAYAAMQAHQYGGTPQFDTSYVNHA